MVRKIRILGVWEGPPKGDFPVEALMSRLKELPDAEIVVHGGTRILSILLAEDEYVYGMGIFYHRENESWMLLLRDRADWEAIKHVAEEYKDKFGSSSSEALNRALIYLRQHIKGQGPGNVDLDFLLE